MDNAVKAPQNSSSLLIAFAVIAIAVGVFVFGDGLYELVNRWMDQDEYSHGFFIPLISLWLLWGRRDALAKSIDSPSVLGVGVLILSMGMLFISELSALFLFSQIGFIVFLFGIVLILGGVPLFKICFIPIFFLCFSIPLPYFIDSLLSWRMQLVSSELGVMFIKAFGIAVYLEGNVIDLGHYKLQVVDACSGLRYLYPLFGLGVMMAYLFQAPIWQRLLVILATIPITIFMNSFRIGVVGFLVEHWGGEMADGLLHYFEGWIIFMACALMLVALMLILSRFNDKKSVMDLMTLPEIDVPEQSPVPNSQKQKVFFSVAGVFLACSVAFVLFLASRTEIIPERPRFISFPQQIDKWQGTKTYLQPRVEHILGLDDYILTNYYEEDGVIPINLYVAYYASQRGGVSPHSPRVCIPGGGWVISDFSKVEVDIESDNAHLPINRVVIDRSGIKQVVYYWFSQRGTFMANEFAVKWKLLSDALFENRTDGALIRLTTPVARGETVEDAEKRLFEFLQKSEPVVAKYLPTVPE